MNELVCSQSIAEGNSFSSALAPSGDAVHEWLSDNSLIVAVSDVQLLLRLRQFTDESAAECIPVDILQQPASAPSTTKATDYCIANGHHELVCDSLRGWSCANSCQQRVVGNEIRDVPGHSLMGLGSSCNCLVYTSNR